jgi:hypothetical protein
MNSRAGRLPILIALALTDFLLPAPCKSQLLTARFYREKQTYLIGEPIFIVLEVTNPSERPIAIDGGFGAPCGRLDPIEVVGALQNPGGLQFAASCFGGWGGDCASGIVELKPGKELAKRILLSRLFAIDHPGTYEVRARRHIPLFANTSPSSAAVSYLDVASDFKIAPTTGNDDELKAAFEPYVRDLASADARAQSNAVDAIATMAPRFLEEVILRLADVPNQAAATTAALGRLNTRQTREKLADLAEHSESGAARQAAIFALAKTGDRTAIPVLERIVRSGQDGDKEFAVWDAGLFGEVVIPFLTTTLQGADLNMQVAGIRGLGVSACRSAVPILIELLRSSNLQLASEARVSLAELTHYLIDSNLWLQAPQPNEYERWREWWQKHGTSAEIYSINNCSQPRPLPPN